MELTGIPLLDGACKVVREADGAGCAKPKGHDGGHYYALHAAVCDPRPRVTGGLAARWFNNRFPVGGAKKEEL
jgi:hypothetical protein